MKKMISKTLMLVALATALFSFTNLGGEGFEILLNNKVVLQQYGNNLNKIQQLKLNLQAVNDQLTVKYHHCGQAGKNRVITVKDAENKILREWRFADATASVAGPVEMTCKVKDIAGLYNGKEIVLKLYYTSSELPKGRLLTNIIVENYSVATVQ